jgi:uncharacterized protein (TIGR00156 family)
MKKLILLAALVSSSVFAQNQVINPTDNAQGGFSSPTASVSSVLSVLNADMSRDDSLVTLTGYIVESLGDEQYTFKDNSGTIQVEIENDKWSNLKVTPSTKITIYGEIDKDFDYTKIDVERLNINQ